MRGPHGFNQTADGCKIKDFEECLVNLGTPSLLQVSLSFDKISVRRF